MILAGLRGVGEAQCSFDQMWHQVLPSSVGVTVNSRSVFPRWRRPPFHPCFGRKCCVDYGHCLSTWREAESHRGSRKEHLSIQAQSMAHHLTLISLVDTSPQIRKGHHDKWQFQGERILFPTCLGGADTFLDLTLKVFKLMSILAWLYSLLLCCPDSPSYLFLAYPNPVLSCTWWGWWGSISGLSLHISSLEGLSQLCFCFFFWMEHQ